MKSILYVGATLMIGASIYGFVDYKQTHRKKEFKEMYIADVSTTPADVTNETKINEPVEKKDIVVTNKKTSSKKQSITKKEKDEEVKGIKAISDDLKITSKQTNNIGDATVSVKAAENPDTEKKVVKKKKKLNSKLFSRAPIREEINFAEEKTTTKSKDKQ